MIEQIALHDPPGKRVSLVRVRFGSIDYFHLTWWICGVGFDDEDIENEVDARRAYDAKRRISPERVAA